MGEQGRGSQHDEVHGGARRAELLGGAATGDLDADEQVALEQLLERDPSAAEELDELRRVLGALPPRGSGWDDAPAPLLGELALEPAPDRRSGAASSSRLDRRPPWLLGAAAAALVVLGVGAGLGAASLVERPTSGPPGTLGAVEEVTVTGEPAGVEAEVAVVAHTWGTETVLDVDGLPVGSAYRVALLSPDGTEVGSGSFLGSERAVECRLNAALLREDVDRLVVLDAGDGVVLTADLPPV